jgi:hypothetical protein
MNGIPMPAIEGCPECGSEYLEAVERVMQGVSLTLDGQGGVATNSTDELMGVTYSRIICRSCEEMLVEDGEAVHDEVDV